MRFLVRWVGYGPEDDEWVCECNAGKAVVQTWKDKKVDAAAERAAARKAAFQAGKQAATNSKGATGDFNLSAAERAEITDKTNCTCLKDVHSSEREATAGILALVASCGIILAATEIYGSESLTQVHLFLYQIFLIHRLPPPEVLCYDDACHLDMYLLNRLGKFGRSVLAVFLIQIHKILIKVDKFHWRNHTGKFCERNNNPYKKCPQLKKAYTERCEETFQC